MNGGGTRHFDQGVIEDGFRAIEFTLLEVLLAKSNQCGSFIPQHGFIHEWTLQHTAFTDHGFSEPSHQIQIAFLGVT